MLRYWYILLMLGVIYSGKLAAAELSQVDSIMKRVTRAAASHSGVVDSYEASVYLKTYIETRKRNILYRYSKLIPNFVIHDPNNDEALIESVSNLKFTAPNSYSQDIKYVSGSLTQKRDIAILPFQFISMDIYAESAHGEIFHLPLREKSSKYYTYSLLKTENIGNREFYTIRFDPIYNNPKLISGYFVVDEKMWRVASMHGEGNDLFLNFVFDVEMGNDINNKYLPTFFNITQSYKYLGNHVVNKFQAKITYKDIYYRVNDSNVKNYNLGNKYRMRLDSVPLNNDSALWDKLRQISLTKDEEDFLKQYNENQRINRAKHQEADTIREGSNDAALKLMKNLAINTRYRFKTGDIRYSGIINPSMMGYSTQDGFSYQQKFAIGFNLPRQQRINVNLFGGYVFGRKQWTYGLNTVWNYEPTRLGYFSIAAGRGNPSYSSRFLHELSDSLHKLQEKNLRFYKDYYFKLFNNIELTNGLQLGVGINYHVRQPIKDALRTANENGDSEIFALQYNFTPIISLSWTPGQYYLLDRTQKIYLRSDYPTFKVEYVQNINGVMGSTSSFNRIEVDINQRIQFGLLNSLNYHAGVGMFSNQKNEYFNDFSYFAKSFFPQSWGDGIGGGFTVLPYHYYHASSKYAQAHLMYETSNLILTRIPQISSGVVRERLYLSQLYTPFIKSYTECGYGIGNRFLNAAFFVGYRQLKFENITAKVAFIL